MELWHYFVCAFDAIVCFFYLVPSSWYCCLQCCNYGKGETSHERFARQARTASAVSDRSNSLASVSEAVPLMEGEEGKAVKRPRRGKRGCWGNCGQMCCNKRVMSQGELLEMHMAESAISSQTSLTAQD